MFHRKRRGMGCSCGLGALTDADFDVAKTTLTNAGDLTNAALVDGLKKLYALAPDAQKAQIEAQVAGFLTANAAKTAAATTAADDAKKKEAYKKFGILGAFIAVIGIGMYYNGKHKGH